MTVPAIRMMTATAAMISVRPDVVGRRLWPGLAIARAARYGMAAAAVRVAAMMMTQAALHNKSFLIPYLLCRFSFYWHESPVPGPADGFS